VLIHIKLKTGGRFARFGDRSGPSQPWLGAGGRAGRANHPCGERHLPFRPGEGEGDLALRLVSLYAQLTEVVRTYAPDEAAVEHTFVNKDAVATLKLGQARGIALLVPAQAGIKVGEYAPNAVKKAIVGVGHAAKDQVDHMVRLHLPGVKIAGPDAADALAIAICHAHHLQSAGRLQAALKRAAG